MLFHIFIINALFRIVAGEGEEFGHEKDRAFLLDDSVSNLPLEPLKHVSSISKGLSYLIKYNTKIVESTFKKNILKIQSSLLLANNKYKVKNLIKMLVNHLFLISVLCKKVGLHVSHSCIFT